MKIVTRMTDDRGLGYLSLRLLLSRHQLHFVSLLLGGRAVHIQQQFHLLLALLCFPVTGWESKRNNTEEKRTSEQEHWDGTHYFVTFFSSMSYRKDIVS